MKKFIYLIFFILFSIFFFVVTLKQQEIYSRKDIAPFLKKTPSVKEMKKNIENLKEISFSQFREGKKIWNLYAKSMKNEDDTVILKSVHGDGITSENKKFYFYAGHVQLNKKDYSFIAKNNIKLIFASKKILGDKLIYNAKKDVYVIFHGIIYINDKFSFSGDKITFIPSSSKIIIGGKND